MKLKINWQSVGSILLAIIVVLLAGYIGYDYYQEKMDEEINVQMQAVYTQGLQQGYEQAVIQVINQATACQPFAVWYENQSIDLIAVQCLQQQ